MRERTRAAGNKLNPYSGKVSQEIRPESLSFLTKNVGFVGPRDLMASTSKMVKEMEDYESSNFRQSLERSPQNKKLNTIQV
jgi:hypothetical protein